MAGGLGGVIKIRGEEEFRNALQKIRQSLRETTSNLSAIASGFSASDKSMDTAKKSAQELNSVLERQQKDHKALQASYEKMNGIYKTSQTAIDNLRNEYQKAEAELLSLEKTLGTSSKEYKDQQTIVARLGQELLNETKIQSDNEVSISRMSVELNKSQTAINKTAKEIQDLEKWIAESAGTTKESISAYDGLKSTIKEQENELKNLKTEYANVILTQGNESKAAQDLARNISDLSGELNDNKSKLNDAEKAANELTKSVAESAETTKESISAYDGLKSTIKEQEDELKNLKTEYANVILTQGNESKAAQDLARNISDLSGELNDNKSKLNDAEKAADELTKSVEEAGESAEGAANGGFTVFKGALANLVSNTIQNAIGKLKELVKGTIDAGKAFDTAMSQVEAISGATGDTLLQLRDKAKEMGATTKFTATESANAFNYMAMAGWTAEEMLEGVDGILNLAAASGADFAETSDIVTDALTAFRQPASEAGRLADVMAAASANANTNVEKMGGTFKYVAPVAGALKYSMEDTAIAIGLMADSGIKAEMAGTSLRAILSRLAAPPKECAEAMDDLGISITNADGTMKPLREVIDTLRSSFSNLSEAEQTSYAKHLAGQEAMSGLLSLVNAAPAKYDQLADAVDNSAGAAKRMADTMLDNVEGGMTLLKSNVEGVQIAIYEKFEPALRKGIDILNNLTNAVRFVVDHSDEFTGALAAMAAGIGTYVAYNTAIQVMTNGWKSLVIVQKAATAAQWALNVAQNASGIGLLISGIAALVVGFTVLWKKSEGFRNFWIGLWETIKSVTQPIIESIATWFSETWEKIKEIWAPVSEFFSNLFNGIVESVDPIIESIGNAFKEAWELIKVVWDLVAPYFQTVWDNIKIIFGVGEAVLSSAFTVAWEVIKTVWAVVVPYFQTVWNNIKAIFSVVKDVLGGAFELAWTAIKAVWNNATSFFKSIWDSIAGIFKVVRSVLTGNWKDAWEGIKGIVNTWVNYFKGVWDNIKNVFSGVMNFFKTIFSSAWTAIKNVFSGWGNFFGGLWDTIKNKFSSLGTTIANAIGGAVKKGINGVISLIENTINSAIGLINGAINLINIIPGVNIGKISKLNMPRLARGGVVEDGARTVIAGEDGAEAIVPLEQNTRWIKLVADQLKDSVFSSEDIRNANNLPSMNVRTEYNFLVESFKEALSEMRIEMDDEAMGKFVDRTVAKAIYD